MGFSAKQAQALRRDIDPPNIRTREIDGRQLSYIEGWYALSEANRIFGFDGWNRETLETRCVFSRENRGNFIVVYVAKVRVTVWAKGISVVRESHGTGEGWGDGPGVVHDKAIKAAETDATKRALATFGRPFGLDLYRGKPKPLENVETIPTAQLQSVAKFARDDTTPIPRPSSYYGRENYHEIREHTGELVRKASNEEEVAPLVPNEPEITRQKIDKSVLTYGEPKRIRDKAHLKFVANQACLVCERKPADAHHLRFAQPRALGMKVSDEFTVPLCRNHHRQLHQAGNELLWWQQFRVDALEVARKLWNESHGRTMEESSLGQKDKRDSGRP